MTPEDLQQKLVLRIQQAQQDPIVYIDRFNYTFDPRKRDNPHLPFRMFDYQKPLALKIKDAIEKGYDLFVDKPRDMGVTYTALGVFLWFWRYVPGSNFLLGSRKESYVDNRFGTTKGTELISNKEESLFGKLDYMLRHQPPFLLPKGFMFDKHTGYMKFLNPENGNIIMGESSNPNFSRSARFKAVLLDEFAFWENDTAAWGATADTTNCRIVLTTAGIRPNTKAERLRFGKDGEKIEVFELDYQQDPRKTPEWEARERSRRSTEDFAREILRDWRVAMKGIVYKEIGNAIVGRFPYVPEWPLYFTWDFGLDGTAVQGWQRNPVNGKKRIVDSFYKVDQPIPFFFPLFNQPINSLFPYQPDDLRAIEAFKVFKKGIHFGDPDVAKRSYVDEKKKSTYDALVEIGVYLQTKPEANDFHTRWEKTKVMLQEGVEVNDTPRNQVWLDAMRQARFPQRSENSQATTPVNKPVHDWTSHHRTATEYFAVNYELPKDPTDVISQFPEENLFNKEGFY